MRGNNPPKTLRRLFGGLLLSFGLAATAQAGDLQVSDSVVVKVSPAAAWALVGDFKGLDRWHPAVVKSSVQGTGREAGDTRLLTLGNGATITEELLAYDDKAMQYKYKIVESPLPVQGYESVIAVAPAGEGASKVSWSATFSAAEGASDKDAKAAIAGVYAAGMAQLEKFYNQ